MRPRRDQRAGAIRCGLAIDIGGGEAGGAGKEEVELVLRLERVCVCAKGEGGISA